MKLDDHFLQDLAFVREQIKDHRSLCEFMGKTEKEVLVAQTIRATGVTLEAEGEPFSVLGNLQDSPHCENTASYQDLVDDGYFAEETRGKRTVIFPTRKLLDALKVFFAK